MRIRTRAPRRRALVLTSVAALALVGCSAGGSDAGSPASGSSAAGSPASSAAGSASQAGIAGGTTVTDMSGAQVAIQVSGSFGSRQEEAQRLGRLLRPKSDGKTARFYTIVSRDTVDADFAQNRQRFLAEQGYAYRIVDADDIAAA